MRSEQLAMITTSNCPIVKNPFVSPLLAPDDLLRGLPPVHIVVSTHHREASQVAERLGIRASIQKVAGLIPSRAKLRFVLGQGTSPYLPRGNVPVLTVRRSG